MRLGNAFRKGYNEAVDTSRRRRSENAELFQSYVKMNADMGAKVSTEDLANYKSSLSGGTSYFGAGLPSSGALQETSKRLGQIQANKQTIAAGNALGNIQTQLAIAKEFGLAYIGTDYSTEEKDQDGKVVPAGSKAFGQFQEQLKGAGIKGDMFTQDWFKNNNFLNQRAEQQQYYRDHNLATLKTDAEWAAAIQNAPQRMVRFMQSLRDTTVNRFRSDTNDAATTSVSQSFQELIPKADTLDDFKSLVRQRFINAHGFGVTPTESEITAFLDLATEEYNRYRPQVITEQLNTVEADTSVDTSNDAAVTAAAKRFFAKNNLGVPTADQIDIFKTNLIEANKPKQLQTAETNFETVKSSLVSSFSSSAKLLQQYKTDEERKTYVEGLLENNSNDYEALKLLDPDIYQRHFDALLSALTIGSDAAIENEKALDEADMLSFISTRGNDLDGIFSIADVGARKEKAFQIINQHRASLGMEALEMVGDPFGEGSEKYPEAFETTYRRLDSRGAVAHAIKWDKNNATNRAALLEQWDTNVAWWENKENVNSLALGDTAQAKLARSVLSSLGRTSHISIGKSRQAADVVMKLIKDMGLDNTKPEEVTADELSAVVDIAKISMQLPERGSKQMWIETQAVLMQGGMPKPQTYYSEYEKMLFGQLEAVAIQRLQRDIANLPITATEEQVEKVRDNILAQLQAGIDTFVEGLDEDEVRWSVREMPNNPQGSIEGRAADVLSRIETARPLVKPEWLTRTKNNAGETAYAMVTADSRKIGKTFKDAEGNLLNPFFYYDLVDGQLVKGQRMTPAAANKIGLVEPKSSVQSDQSGSKLPGYGIHNAFAKDRNRTGDGALAAGFQRIFGGASDEHLQNNLPFQVAQADNNAARLAENQTQTETAQTQAAETEVTVQSNIQALQDGLTPELVTAITEEFTQSIANVDIKNFGDRMAWQQNEMPRVLKEILEANGLPSDDTSISMALQMIASRSPQ
ncbi:MAG TPA: hypothetical protein DCW52_11215 [Gammaproteobacteria bacterium]|nr:hypothetical protein [Gammaproteobacteria bacterium]